MAERSRKGMAGRTGRLIMNKEEKEMTNKERRDAGMAYVSDDSVFKEQQVCRRKLQKLNFMDRSDLKA